MIFLLKKGLEKVLKFEFLFFFDIIYLMKLNIYMANRCNEIGDVFWAFQ